MCNPHDLLHIVQGKEMTHFRDGDTDDIISVVLMMDKKAQKSIRPTGVECLRGKTNLDTLNNVWSFVKTNIKYKADKGSQVIKSPGALFGRGVGDCKSFSIAIVALCRALGFREVKYRFVSYDPVGPVSHVFPVVRTNGRWVAVDAVHDLFDDEAPYNFRIDYDAAKIGGGINGPEKTSQHASTSGWLLFLLALGIIYNTK